MSYVTENLTTNEEVIRLGKVHWVVFVPSAILAGIGAWAFQFALEVSVFLFAVATFFFLKSLITVISTELAITNKRVIAKFGLISRETVELNLSKVESVNVDQSITGRMLGFGTININGTGGVKTPIPNISKPMQFKKSAAEKIDEAQPA